MSADVPAEVARVEGLLREAMARAVTGGATIARGVGWHEGEGGLCCAVGAAVIDLPPGLLGDQAAIRLGVDRCAVTDIVWGFDGAPSNFCNVDWHALGARLAAYAVEQGWLST